MASTLSRALNFTDARRRVTITVRLEFNDVHRKVVEKEEKGFEKKKKKKSHTHYSCGGD